MASVPVTARPEPGIETPSWFDGRHVYLVGIGGCGVCGLARLLKSLGAVCSGSDSTPSAVTGALEADGIPVSRDQKSGKLPERCDLVV
ncbi:MAG: hypothetical protein GY715_21970, partial [Planctomycetes bacterium]|nr:hypothetical protein [Planctomycetota bacterium]